MARVLIGDAEHPIAACKLWNAETGQLLHELNAGKDFQHVTVTAWSDDGQRVCLVDGSGNMGVWNAKTGARISNGKAPGHRGFPSPDGRIIAFDDQHRVIRFWQFEGNRDLGSFVILNRGQAIGLSPSGHYQATRFAENDIVFVAKTSAGQETYSPADFATKFGWKNDPQKAQIRPANIKN